MNDSLSSSRTVENRRPPSIVRLVGLIVPSVLALSAVAAFGQQDTGGASPTSPECADATATTGSAANPTDAGTASDATHEHTRRLPPGPFPPQLLYAPTPVPDRVLLTWTADPARSIDVSWRTNINDAPAVVEIAPAATLLGDLRSTNVESAVRFEAETAEFDSSLGAYHIHSAHVAELMPDTVYAYRVGNEDNWSEWFQFRTACEEPKPFTFVYFGDAQNSVKSMWSRVIRDASQQAPRAAFMLHAGDLINNANNEEQWGEWYGAGGWLNGMIPTVATPGNHEYASGLSRHWRPQFAFPTNGPEGLEETAYWFDYQGVRIVSLNSNEMVEEQTPWLDEVLQKDPQPRWKIVTFHHPVYSAAKDRDNPTIRDQWKPLFDRHHVDLALQGHDHAYARTGLGGPANAADVDGDVEEQPTESDGDVEPVVGTDNVPAGVNTRRGHTVYVVSVSGPKMYDLNETWDVPRAASGVQLYQVIHVGEDEIRYEARLAHGTLYDSFVIQKGDDGQNELQNLIPDTPEIRK